MVPPKRSRYRFASTRPSFCDSVSRPSNWNPNSVEMRTLCQPPDAVTGVVRPSLTTQLPHVAENKQLSYRSGLESGVPFNVRS